MPYWRERGPPPQVRPPSGAEGPTLVPPPARLAEAVPLHRLGEDDRRAPLGGHRRLVGGEHLRRVVAAAPHLGELLVGEPLDERQQLGVLAEEVVAEVGARLDGVLLP